MKQSSHTFSVILRLCISQATIAAVLETLMHLRFPDWGTKTFISHDPITSRDIPSASLPSTKAGGSGNRAICSGIASDVFSRATAILPDDRCSRASDTLSNHRQGTVPWVPLEVRPTFLPPGRAVIPHSSTPQGETDSAVLNTLPTLKALRSESSTNRGYLSVNIGQYYSPPTIRSTDPQAIDGNSCFE